MDRAEAMREIKKLKGQDLRALADKYGVTVKKGEKSNKGWAGHVVERYLGLPLNSAQAPNFGSWELKVVPLAYRKDRTLRVKETMAITMLDPIEVMAKSFEESHLYLKLRKILIVSRVFENQQETSSLLHDVAEFDLNDPALFQQVKADYNLVRQTLKSSGVLTGKMGVLVQPRTKGPGHGSTSRAFYARTGFVSKLLGLKIQGD